MGEDFEVTQKRAENLEEKAIRWNIKQSAKGGLYYEFTIRADTIEEAKTLTLKSKEELEAICSV